MVDAVDVKLPPFCTSDTALFAQVEGQFAIHKITEDDIKYYHVVSAMDSATDTRAVYLLSAPPATRKYIAIKTNLVH